LPPPGGIRITDPNDKTRKIPVAAGGAEYMATLVKQLRDGHENAIFVAAGDLIGASPLLSGLFHDEPTIESLSQMGLAITAVGNHEFDEGKDELLRMQNGGCNGDDTCRGPRPFKGAAFHYLAASTIDTATGKTVFPAYEIREFEGIPVAFIGLTLKGTPDIVWPVSVAGLEFRDEADTVNALVPELRARGVEAIVVLIHQGGFPAGDHDDECTEISGPIVDIVKKFDRAVDVVVSGHTHRAYVCQIDGRLLGLDIENGVGLLLAVGRDKARLEPAEIEEAESEQRQRQNVDRDDPAGQRRYTRPPEPPGPIRCGAADICPLRRRLRRHRWFARNLATCPRRNLGRARSLSGRGIDSRRHRAFRSARNRCPRP